MLTLSLGKKIKPLVTGSTPSERFQSYHRQHRQVYSWFRQEVRRQLKRGRERFSARGVFEEIRHGTVPRKIPNQYSHHYVDLFVADFPHLAYFFDRKPHREKANK